MNDLGGGSSCSSNGGNGSDSSGMAGDSKLCRDFIRNVCHRGKNCKFIHPENIKIRSDPIFCHDFQQNRCHRPTCKFVHCSREIEDHYKKTGELPDNVYDNESGHGKGSSSSSSSSRPRSGDGGMRSNKSGSGSRSNGNSHGMDSGYNNHSADVPVCKDYLKGACNRPVGACKYRHVSSQNDGGRTSRSNGNGNGRSMNGNGSTKNGGPRRRGSDGSYDSGPENKRMRSNDNVGFAFGMGGVEQEFTEDFYVGNSIGRGYSAMPPHAHSESHQMPNPHHQHHGPPVSSIQDTRFSQFQQTHAAFAVAGSRNGFSGGETSVAAYLHSADTIKALEDENFMLKRRIEELKTANEFLLGQNTQLRQNPILSVSRNSVAVENVQVQPTVGVASVANGVMVSMAQPIGISPCLSVAATQPVSTISTLPTVSMPAVSISQALPIVSIAQHQAQPQSVYPMVTTQGVLPPPPNLS